MRLPHCKGPWLAARSSAAPAPHPRVTRDEEIAEKWQSRWRERAARGADPIRLPRSRQQIAGGQTALLSVAGPGVRFGDAVFVRAAFCGRLPCEIAAAMCASDARTPFPLLPCCLARRIGIP